MVEGALSDGLVVRLRQEGPIALAVDFEVAASELVALVGPSGAGKSTILRTIAGLYRPLEGQVKCRGEIWLDTANGLDRKPQQRAAGLVFQSYALFPHLSALANVELALGQRPRGERRSRALELLRTVHLEGFENRRPDQLSGGQQQRVAVARALARDPSVLLLDEPFSAVDRSTRRLLHRELLELRQKMQVPIVLVTHDLDEACALTDRLVLIENGRSLATGRPRDLLEQPASPAVARLLGLRTLTSAKVLEVSEQRVRVDWYGLKFDLSAPQTRPEIGIETCLWIPPAALGLAPEKGESAALNLRGKLLSRFGHDGTIEITILTASGTVEIAVESALVELPEIGAMIDLTVAAERLRLL